MNEVASLDDRRIIELLAGLDRVSAPGDFNFRVRSRIAAGAPASRRSWSAALKLAFPILLVLVISGFLFMRDAGPVVSDQVAKVEDVQLVPSAVSQEPATAAAVVAVPQSPTVLPQVKPEQKQTIAMAKPDTAATEPAHRAVNRQTEEVASSGSYDIGGGVSRGISLPINENVNRPAPAPRPAVRPRLSSTGVFSLMGIRGSFSGSEFKVQGIVSGSAAEQSGIRAGDIVEAINGQSLSSGLSFANDFTGGTLRVRRNGQLITVNVGQ